jgi:hypothetical protein
MLNLFVIHDVIWIRNSRHFDRRGSRVPARDDDDGATTLLPSFRTAIRNPRCATTNVYLGSQPGMTTIVRPPSNRHSGLDPESTSVIICYETYAVLLSDTGNY